MRIALEETVPPPKPIFTPDNFEEEFMQWIREKNQKEYEAFCRSVDWDSIKFSKWMLPLYLCFFCCFFIFLRNRKNFFGFSHFFIRLFLHLQEQVCLCADFGCWELLLSVQNRRESIGSCFYRLFFYVLELCFIIEVCSTSVFFRM